MILVFAGQENSPVLPGMHHLIGTCETVVEARGGFGMWCEQQRAEWLATLAKIHPMPYAQTIARNAKFWYQFAEHRPGQDPEYVVIQEDGRPGVSSAPSGELYWARQALLAFDRSDAQGEDGDPGQSAEEHARAMEYVEKWRELAAKTLQ